MLIFTRFIPWGLPNTVEEYVQESGRSGRDGRSAEAILYQGKVELHCTHEGRYVKL